MANIQHFRVPSADMPGLSRNIDDNAAGGYWSSRIDAAISHVMTLASSRFIRSSRDSDAAPLFRSQYFKHEPHKMNIISATLGEMIQRCARVAESFG